MSEHIIIPVQNLRWDHSLWYVVFLRLFFSCPNPGAFSGYHRLARTVLLRMACQSPNVEGLDSMVHRSLRLRSAPYVSHLISTAVFRLSTYAHRDPSVGGIGTTIAATKVPYIADFPKFHIIVAVWCTGAVLADMTITGTLVLYLVRRLRITGYLSYSTRAGSRRGDRRRGWRLPTRSSTR